MRCIIQLPPDFRLQDVLSFHKRDQLMAAERVEGYTLHKGLVWQGHAACLTINFHPLQAEAILAIDGSPADNMSTSLDQMVRRMLGLTQQIEEFEATYRHHPEAGPLIVQHPGLRVPLSATPFEALTWAIIGQQISLHAAIAVRRRLIQAAGMQHSSGLYCYPDAAGIEHTSEEQLRQAGLSQSKTRTLIELSRRNLENLLPLEEWTINLPVDEMREKLLLVPGIGPWTINYALLRGYGWLDGSLHGDVAVRRNLQTLLDHPEKISEKYARDWLEEFSPWRALIAAHLWAMKSLQA
nr:AlkA N-terminal domain-containing protein [Pelotalea chapellei]